MKTPHTYSTKTTDTLAILIIIFLLAALAFFKIYFWLFPSAPPAVEEEWPPQQVAPYTPAPPPITLRVIEPPPLPPGDDGTEEKLRDMSWLVFGNSDVAYSNVHSAYINRFYAYSLGYVIGSEISLPPRNERTTLTNTDGKKSTMMLLVSDDLSDPARLHLRQLFYDGYAIAVGAREHKQASSTCNSGGCYLIVADK